MGCTSPDSQVPCSLDSEGCDELRAPQEEEPTAESLSGAAEDGDTLCQGAGPSASSRGYCERCGRAARVCVCGRLPAAPFGTETRLVVLIHPKETRRACGTVPLLRLCLENLSVVCGASFGEREEEAPEELLEELFLPGRPLQLRQPTFLVAPGPSAQVLQRRVGSAREEEEAEAEASQPQQAGAGGRACTLVFVDATWRLAKQMVYRTPWLQNLPRVCLEPEEESHYAFRRQPKKECLSTLEAVAECLLALEKDTAKAEEVHSSLSGLFDAMVAHQVSFIPKLGGSKDPGLPADAASGAASLPELGAEAEAKALQRPPRRGPVTTSYCLARHERGLGGVLRRAVVEETLRNCSYEDAVARGKELSANRSKEDRLHVVPLEKVRRMKSAGGVTFVMEQRE